MQEVVQTWTYRLRKSKIIITKHYKVEKSRAINNDVAREIIKRANMRWGLALDYRGKQEGGKIIKTHDTATSEAKMTFEIFGTIYRLLLGA